MLKHFPEFGSNDALLSEILGMARYTIEYGYYGKERDLKWSRQLNPQSLTWEQFLRHTGWKGQKLLF